ncbi:MAG: response regulator [Tenuifilaceae bacterium]|jgi:CheY-like chemotaxis protein/signal transduction histidine kinase|nr:response regulator [Bacteroidales bacterium]MDI9515489.1 response regulator [Bacteroidota bacterium]NLH56144.1 response regulator [Rikenellaceae bacterium]OQC63639.1 MAG: Sensory/regulatory protein RpfC [Bacteroidetes bacterium ADurb.Bin008]HNV81154.1 response regulator [Tenuifilaceae bacterium]
MNLSDKLLHILSFRIEKKCGKDHVPRMLTLTVASTIIAIYFFILGILSLFPHNFLQLVLSFSACFLILVNQWLVIKKVQFCNFLYFPIILLLIIFQYFLWSGSISFVGTLVTSLFPLIAIGLLGYFRGSLASLAFAILAAIGFFIPLSINVGYELELAVKINFFLSFFIVTAMAYLFEKIRQISINELEKQVLDQQSANKLNEQFIANLSHQIRTPLNNIMVISSILETSGTLDEKQKDLIDTIHASTNNLANVVNSMVEISNVNLKERGDIYVPFNLHGTINSTLRLFSTQYDSDTSFNLKIDDSIPDTLSGDPVKLKQIFLTLIEILKHKSSGKTIIFIKVTKQGETPEEIIINFRIDSNRPILLPMNEGRSLFVTNETIYSSASTQAYIELLDLTITQKIIESNGGELIINLSPQDAVFNFTYALRKEVLTPTVTASEISTEPEQDTGKPLLPKVGMELEQASVLLVEDNLINQKIVVLSLKKLVKNIEIANNGKEALDKIASSRFDIILMDIQMPIMNGFVTTKKIRDIEASSNTHTPIIAITANALLGDKEECLASGMDDYISKPFQIEVLIQKMKNLLKA